MCFILSKLFGTTSQANVFRWLRNSLISAVGDKMGDLVADLWNN